MQPQFDVYLAECLALARAEVSRWIPARTRVREELYELVLDYPLREAKGLRPALCIAACRGLGGALEAVLPTAAVLELYHNAFLVHDDVEDGSEERRGDRTLHAAHGVPIAVNVGDAMLAMTLKPLLDNIELIGLGRALRVLRAISEMTLTSVEGQALELHWVHNGLPDADADSYVRMVQQKTAHYSFVTPLEVGALIAGADDEQLQQLRDLGSALGVAFQIQDDLLNLEPHPGYGKEVLGDLWEGKYTLAVIHALGRAGSEERNLAQRLLKTPRSVKTHEDVAWLQRFLEQQGGPEYAAQVAKTWAEIAARKFGSVQAWFPRSVHSEFLAAVVEFVVTRSR
jgi:geranylgeranyl diphosphate synthase, type II